LFDAVDMRWDWPVDVNYHEAQAFCAWRTAQDGALVRFRVLTEAEHQFLRNARDRSDAYLLDGGSSDGRAANGHAANGHAGKAAAGKGGAVAISVSASAGGAGAGARADNVDMAMVVSGADAAQVRARREGRAACRRRCRSCVCVHACVRASGLSRQCSCASRACDALQVAGANYQLAYGSQNPVTALPPSEAGFHDVFGSAWEWAEDHFAAFPGFKVHPVYEDFSTPCFAGLHQMVGWRLGVGCRSLLAWKCERVCRCMCTSAHLPC
jgi:formylglycine-generating enzyme required for sulfatase activity